ncbi:MAG: hypothetical protein ABW161_01220 [Candidatus Thiodiazotropha sp.]
MAIQDYQSLQGVVADYLHRSDLADAIQGYIQLAEARLNRDLTLPSQRCDRRVVLAAGLRRVRLPEDFTEFLSLWEGSEVSPYEDEVRRWSDVSGTWSAPLAAASPTASAVPPGRRLRYVNDQDLVVHEVPGKPVRFTILGGRLLFERPAALPQTYRLHYVRRFALSAHEPTNHLLKTYPDVYLYATLLEAPVWSFDDDRLAVYQDRYDRAVAGINEQEAAGLGDDVLCMEWGGGNGFSIREG